MRQCYARPTPSKEYLTLNTLQPLGSPPKTTNNTPIRTQGVLNRLDGKRLMQTANKFRGLMLCAWSRMGRSPSVKRAYLQLLYSYSRQNQRRELKPQSPHPSLVKRLVLKSKTQIGGRKAKMQRHRRRRQHQRQWTLQTKNVDLILPHKYTRSF